MTRQKIKEDTLLDIWNGTQGASSGSVYEDDLRELHRAMGVRSRHGRSAGSWLAWSAAAFVLLLVMAGEYYFLKLDAVPQEKVSYVTSPASKGEFVLPDGSHVWLNSSSSLSFDSSSPRQVKLEGEGFFDVARKDGEPFVVSTGAVSVKVLGTRFNVRSSSHFDREEVSLLSGRVEISSAGGSAILSPGEKAEFFGGVIEKEVADVSFDCSWTGQELVFDDASLSDIITGLEHWYNVNILPAPDVPLSSRLSFKVRRETIQETQRIITRITGCHFKALDEKNIMITK